MNTQERTSREEALDKIVESMYNPVTESKPHNCATHVEHSKWGKGECISESHAEPDENGNVAWYNVIFEHGTEKVNTDDVKVVKSSHHMHASHKPKKKKKVNETDDWASRRIDHSAKPKEPITISPGKGEEYLIAQKAIGDHEDRMTDLGWNRCSHGCVPSVEGNKRSPDYGQVEYTHADGSRCRVCKGSGFLDAEGSPPSGQRRVIGDPEPHDRSDPSWVNASTEIKVEADYVPPHDEDKLKRAKERGYNDDNDDSDIDHHNKYMMDQDLLQPIHQAASIATDGEAKNFNEWLILQIKDQGDNWIDWFIETVIVEERFKD